MQTILNRRVEFNISKYVNEGWEFTKFNLCQFIGIALIYTIVTVAIFVGYVYAVWGSVQNFLYHGVGAVADDETDGVRFYEMDWNSEEILISLAVSIGAFLLFYVPALGSMYKAVFNAMRNNSRIKFSDFFSCFTCPYWFRLGLLALVLFVVRQIGFWLFFFPGFYFALATSFSIPMHGEHSFIGIATAINYSFKIFNRYFCSMLAFVLCLGFLQVLGFLFFGVGLLVSIPVAFVATCYCYHHLIGVNGVAVLVPITQLEGVPPALSVQLTQLPSAPANV